jgi:hypothetical protein
MDDAERMRRRHAVGDLHREVQKRLVVVGCRDRRALDELHHQVVRSDVVNLANVGMIQRGDGFRFTIESLTELRGGNFDRDIAIQAWIARLPHFPPSLWSAKFNLWIMQPPLLGNIRGAAHREPASL